MILILYYEYNISNRIYNLPFLLFLKVLLIWNFLSKFGDELISIINTALDSILFLP
jgi:hypothetical protein